jgi:hypothetical protein
MATRGTFRFDEKLGEVVLVRAPKAETPAPRPPIEPKLYTGQYL